MRGAGCETSEAESRRSRLMSGRDSGCRDGGRLQGECSRLGKSGDMTDLAENQWTADRARQWYDEQPWIVGCNFLPSNPVSLAFITVTG